MKKEKFSETKEGKKLIEEEDYYHACCEIECHASLIDQAHELGIKKGELKHYIDHQKGELCPHCMAEGRKQEREEMHNKAMKLGSPYKATRNQAFDEVKEVDFLKAFRYMQEKNNNNIGCRCPPCYNDMKKAVAAEIEKLKQKKSSSEDKEEGL